MRGAAVIGAFLGLLTLAADATAQSYRDDRGSQSTGWGGGYAYDGHYRAGRYGDTHRDRYGDRYRDGYRGVYRYDRRRYYGSRNRYRRHSGRRYAYGRGRYSRRRDTYFPRGPQWRRYGRRFSGAPHRQPRRQPRWQVWQGYRVWREVEPAR
jgi:hypothetical protein